MNRYILSVDLGRLSDWTAFAVLEEDYVETTKTTPRDLAIGHRGDIIMQSRLLLRHLERPDMGTPYDKIIGKIAGLMRSPELAGNTDLVVDATGVGRPVVDIMLGLGLDPIAITITGGQEVSIEKDGGGAVAGYKVPKHDIVGALNAYFTMDRLKMSTQLPLVPALKKELQVFVPKITKALNVTYEALREGDHDDLVLAVAIGVWWKAYTRPDVTKVNILSPSPKPYDPYAYLDDDHDEE
jgi:hypothetical protein